MGRIRTIKPDLFRHAALFDAEIDSGLPLRFAFAGFFTVADRCGRFKWRPRELKLDVLPHDSLDFGRVLDELNRHGFIVKYEVEGEAFGCIPTWEKHQVINNREADSVLPPPPAAACPTRPPRVPDASATRAPRVNDACPTPLVHAQAEGDWKGKEGEGETPSSASTTADPPGFSEFWGAWPTTARKVDRKKCAKKWKASGLAGHASEILAHIDAMKQTKQWQTSYEPAPLTYLNGERWRDGVPSADNTSHIDGSDRTRNPMHADKQFT